MGIAVDEYSVRRALRGRSVEWPGIDVERLVMPVTHAWTAHDDSGLHIASVAAVIDATWPLGYRAGVAQAHRFVADFFGAAARQEIAHPTGLSDAEGARVLRAVVGTSAAISGMQSAAKDPGPTPGHYLCGIEDQNWRTDAEHAAAAAWVGWSEGHREGGADGAWFAAGRIMGTVKNLLGERVVHRAVIAGTSAQDWLTRVDVTSRQPREVKPDRPSPSTAQAFPPLRAVHADTSDASDGHVDGSHQDLRRRGRHR